MTDIAQSIIDVAHSRFAVGRGGAVFLAGGPGAGQGLVFDELPGILAQHRQPPALLRGRIAGGAYIPGQRPDYSLLETLLNAMELTTQVAAMANPMLSLLAQILSSTSNAQRFARELSSRRSSIPSEPRLPQRAIRALADQRPLCFAVECTDPVSAQWWLKLIESLAIEAEVDLPLMMILGVEGPSVLPAKADHQPALVNLARSLVSDKRAKWLAMPVLDKTTVQPLIGSSDLELCERLCAVTGGQAGWAVDLFGQWRERGVVMKDRRGLWTFDHAELAGGLAPTKDIVIDRLHEVLGDDLSSVAKSKRLLALAALQGEVFILEPIAHLLEMSPERCEQMARTLADDSRCRPLLEPASHGLLGDPGEANPLRYRFVDRLIWFSLTRYGLAETDRRDAAVKCAAFLEREHSSDLTQIAGTLATLYAFAEDEARRHRWRGIAEISASDDLLRWQVKAAVADEPQWSRWNRERALATARFLLDASVRLSRTRPWDEMCASLEAVERLAGAHDLKLEHCAGVRLQGKIYAAAGDYDRARERFHTASGVLGFDGDASERYHVLCELAHLDRLEGDLPRALERLDEAIDARQVEGEPRAEAAAHEERGEIALELGNVVDAERDLATAIRLARESNDGNCLSSSLTKLSMTQLVKKDIPGAISSLREALEISQVSGNKAREQHARACLGTLIQDPAESYREHQRALVLARELNDVPAEADSLLSLARQALALRQWDEASRLLQEGFDLQSRSNDALGAAWFLREIGVLQTYIGALPQARRNLDAALQTFRAENVDDGLAATHHALGNLAARTGDRAAAKREFALATNLGLPAADRGHVVHVVHRTRPQRGWHPKR